MNILTGNGPPSRYLKGEVGQHYKDLDTGDIYECVSANEHSRVNLHQTGGYIWKKMATGDHIEACTAAANSPTQVVILPETELTYEETEGAWLNPSTTEFDHYPEIGKTYAVAVNGIEYSAYAISGAKIGMREMTDVALLIPAVALICPVKPTMIEAANTNLAVQGVTEELSTAESCTISIIEEGDLKPLVVNATNKTETTAPTGAKAAYTLTLDKDYDEIIFASATGQTATLAVNSVLTLNDVVTMQLVLETAGNGIHFHAQANGHDFETTVVNNDNVTFVVREVSADSGSDGGGVFIVTATPTTGDGGASATFDKTYEETLTAIKAGKNVVVWLTDDTGRKVFYPFAFGDDGMSFMYITYSNGIKGATIAWLSTGQVVLITAD